ncbi:MAG: hypothetical protein EOM54_13410 [Clostridia bacterium]|nr:hypothetical protein [Clostridia bacterium]
MNCRTTGHSEPQADPSASRPDAINKKLKQLTREQANELAAHLNDAMNAALTHAEKNPPAPVGNPPQ